MTSHSAHHFFWFFFFSNPSAAISLAHIHTDLGKPQSGKWPLQPDLSFVSAAAPSSLRHQVFIFLPFLPSKVPNSSVPSIKMSAYITHMIKIKAKNSPCILSSIGCHLAGPGTQLSSNKTQPKTSPRAFLLWNSAKIRLWIWKKTQPTPINILNFLWFSTCLPSFTFKEQFWAVRSKILLYFHQSQDLTPNWSW